MTVYQLELHVGEAISDRSDLREVEVIVTDGNGNEWVMQGHTIGGAKFVEIGLPDLVFTASK